MADILPWALSWLGLIILLLAGDALVKGAVNLSLRLGVPALIVSLTISRIISTIIIPTKGSAPQATSLNRPPRVRIPCTTYKFTPIGGVISAASISTMTRMPNQTGSYPMLITSGKTTGTVVSIIDKVSMNMPRIR